MYHSQLAYKAAIVAPPVGCPGRRGAGVKTRIGAQRLQDNDDDDDDDGDVEEVDLGTEPNPIAQAASAAGAEMQTGVLTVAAARSVHDVIDVDPGLDADDEGADPFDDAEL